MLWLTGSYLETSGVKHLDGGIVGSSDIYGDALAISMYCNNEY